MAIYRRILVAVDLTQDSPYIAQRGRALASALDADLELLHVVEPAPMLLPISAEAAGPDLVQSQDELLASARRDMSELAGNLGVADSQWSVQIGSTKTEIVRIASERLADVIVLGRRERHGLSLTEDAVLHKAPCDVLAVRIGSA